MTTAATTARLELMRHFSVPIYSALATPQAVPVTLAGDVITFDLTAAATDAGSSAGPCGVIKVTVKDACCTTSTVTVTAFWDAEISQITSGGCGGDAG